MCIAPNCGSQCGFPGCAVHFRSQLLCWYWSLYNTQCLSYWKLRNFLGSSKAPFLHASLIHFLPGTQSQFVYIFISFSFLVLIGHEGNHILWTFWCQQETSYYLWPMCSFICNHIGIVSITKSCALKRSILPFLFFFFPLEKLGHGVICLWSKKCLWLRNKIWPYNFEQLEHYWIIIIKSLFFKWISNFQRMASLIFRHLMSAMLTLIGCKGNYRKFSEYH